MSVAHSEPAGSPRTPRGPSRTRRDGGLRLPLLARRKVTTVAQLERLSGGMCGFGELKVRTVTHVEHSRSEKRRQLRSWSTRELKSGDSCAVGALES